MDARTLDTVIVRALQEYRSHCFDDSEFGVAIDAFLSGNPVLLKQAEDYSENIRRELAQSPWIKITDDPQTLPEWDGIKDYVHVRVYGPKIEIMCAPADAYMRYQCDAIFDGKDFWIGDTQVTEAVTHYQPLAPPPES